jgi:hypothetical protein
MPILQTMWHTCIHSEARTGSNSRTGLEKRKKLALSSLELDRRQRLNRRATILRSEKVHADASLGPLLRAPRSLAGGGGGSASPLIQYRARALYRGGPRRLR